jgi:hypothetical protein
MMTLSAIAILLLVLAAIIIGCVLVAHALYGLFFPASRH